ncbi:translation initiation factor IF-2 subunit alpha [Candidatus Woesearchaeota archaeon]|nr:translation initiation factor IF-2 subunit alpha [Candidatus Woesearchaeota archaeon]
MKLKKKGLPGEGELVICTVTKIHYNSVFANIDEYERKQGMIHISEISPGRIRNIRDFIREGKVIVCKVLRVDTVKGHIDLSLRRVTESQRRGKADSMKQEQLSEKIVEFVAKALKTDNKTLFDNVFKAIENEYDSVYLAFIDVVEGVLSINELGLDKKTSQKLEEVIRQRIKPKEVEIKGDLTLESFAPDGVEIVKKALINAEKSSDKVTISYEGGGKYRITVNAKEYKEAEEILKNTYTQAISDVEKTDGKGEFVRVE